EASPPGNASGAGWEHEDDRDYGDPRDRDRVDPAVVPAQAPLARFEVRALPGAEDHRLDVGDVERGRADRGGDVVADDVVPPGRNKDEEACGAAREHRHDRHAAPRHLPPPAMAGNGAVARE